MSTEDDSPAPPRVKPEVRAFLLHTARMVEEAGTALRALIDRGDLPTAKWMEAWHALEEAGEALRDAQPPGWQPGRTMGTVPPLPPPRRDRGLIR